MFGYNFIHRQTDRQAPQIQISVDENITPFRFRVGLKKRKKKKEKKKKMRMMIRMIKKKIKKKYYRNMTIMSFW